MSEQTEVKRTRRIGRFCIAAELVDAMDARVMMVMGICAIFRAECMWASRRIEYVAACDRFREVPEGEIFPEYRWIVNEDGDIQCEEVTGPRYSNAYEFCL